MRDWLHSDNVALGGTFDLRVKPFVRDAKRWCDPDDYGACQAFARCARAAQVRTIRYESVRDPARGGGTQLGSRPSESAASAPTRARAFTGEVSMSSRLSNPPTSAQPA
jgi:RES domain